VTGQAQVVVIGVIHILAAIDPGGGFGNAFVCAKEGRGQAKPDASLVYDLQLLVLRHGLETLARLTRHASGVRRGCMRDERRLLRFDRAVELALERLRRELLPQIVQ
jgi:hypothetical protein